MSDVASAFKILIQANPEQAVSAFKDILKSTVDAEEATRKFNAAAKEEADIMKSTAQLAKDAASEEKKFQEDSAAYWLAQIKYEEEANKATETWADSWTELNSILEVGGKIYEFVSGAISSIVDSTVAATKATVEFISAGGDYNEQKVQFEAVAASYKMSGESIVSTLQDITDNNISLADAMNIGTKAIGAGLSEQDQSFQVSMTFAKKWSEATGENFNEVAESLVKAFATGKYNSLAQMKFIISDTTDMGDIMKQIFTRLNGEFVDAGTNAADAFGSISQSWENLFLQLGNAVNKSGIGEAISKLAEDMAAWVNGIDYNAVTAEVDKIFNAITGFAERNGVTWETIKEQMNSVWQEAVPFAIESIDTIGNALEDLGNYFAGMRSAVSEQLGGNWFEDLVTHMGEVKDKLFDLKGSFEIAFGSDTGEIMVSFFALVLDQVTATVERIGMLIDGIKYLVDIAKDPLGYGSKDTASDENTVAELGPMANGRTTEQMLQAIKERKSLESAKQETYKKSSYALSEEQKAILFAKNGMKDEAKDAKEADKAAKKNAADALKSQKELNKEADKAAKKNAADALKSQKELNKEAEKSSKKQDKVGKYSSFISGNADKIQQDLVNASKLQSNVVQDVAWYLSKVADALEKPVRVQPSNTTGAIEQLINEVLRQAVILAREEGTKVLAA